MHRRWFAAIGSALVLLAGYLAGRGPTTGRTDLGLVLLGAGGVLLALGGYDPFPERIAWNRLLGVGAVLVGASLLVMLAVPALTGARDRDALVLAATGLVNATLLGLVGIDWYLGGVVFDLSSLEPGSPDTLEEPPD